jgi:hypothetical protein
MINCLGVPQITGKRLGLETNTKIIGQECASFYQGWELLHMSLTLSKPSKAAASNLCLYLDPVTPTLPFQEWVTSEFLTLGKSDL